ncbi:MAG: hypothetical protein JWO42_4138 [Chloroflexi bacterium]|nr:hypothetical protein [Chloroflexota bacterium]
MDSNDVLPVQPQLNGPKPKHTRPLVWRMTGVTMLIGGLAAGGLALSHGGQGTMAAASTSSVTSSSVAASTIASTTTTPSTTRHGLGRFGGGTGGGNFGRAGHHGGGLTVTGVSGNTITATGRGGQTVTITVDSNTKYTEAGASAALTDIQNGSVIQVQGSSTGQNTSTATSIQIVLPSARGVVTSATGSTLTLTGFNGRTQTINVSSTTRYDKAGQTAALSDVSNGTAVTVQGTTNADGSMNAQLVTIQLPNVEGQVTAASNGTYTLSGKHGNTSVTVNTSSSTTYVDQSGATVQPSTITTNTNIVAEGTLSPDGKTLTAQRITVLPAAPAGMGSWSSEGGRRGSFTLPGSGSSTTPSTGSTTSSSTTTSGSAV